MKPFDVKRVRSRQRLRRRHHPVQHRREFAFDQEFLYVALKCKHLADQGVEPMRHRPRDAHVDAFDAVSIMLGLDRDDSTHFHLKVDQRGCVRDSCWGGKNCSPRGLVAVQRTDVRRNIEAAMPLDDQTSEPITQQSGWAFNVERIMPGRAMPDGS